MNLEVFSIILIYQSHKSKTWQSKWLFWLFLSLWGLSRPAPGLLSTIRLRKEKKLNAKKDTPLAWMSAVISTRGAATGCGVTIQLPAKSKVLLYEDFNFTQNTWILELFHCVSDNKIWLFTAVLNCLYSLHKYPRQHVKCNKVKLSLNP